MFSGGKKNSSALLQSTISLVFSNLKKKRYLSSGRDEENFCATVPKDGRSYSPTLFSQTVRVLKKINKPGDMILAFGLLADKIKVELDLSLSFVCVEGMGVGGTKQLDEILCCCFWFFALVSCRQTAAGRRDVFRCSRWVLGPHHVHSDAGSCSSPFFQCNSRPLNYSKAPAQVS